MPNPVTLNKVQGADAFEDISCNGSSMFVVFFRLLGKRHFQYRAKLISMESCLVICLRGGIPYYNIRTEIREHLSVRKQRFSLQKSLHCCLKTLCNFMRAS
jgi:hypothetical protein